MTAAEAARAAGEDTPAAWAAIAASWDELADPYEVARARWREAEAHARAGDRPAAEAAARAAPRHRRAASGRAGCSRSSTTWPAARG